MNIAIIFAGGSGVRMGAGMPKQFLEINGKPIIIHTLDNFQNSPSIDKIYISCKKDYITTLQDLTKRFAITKVCGIVEGGSNGQDSIYRALRAADAENDKDAIVLIHDGVRPFVSVEVIRRCYELAEVQKAVIPVVDVVETLRHLTDAGSETVSRIDYKLVQTPQVFDVELLQQAYAQEFTPFFTDDASVVEAMGMPVYLAEGNRENIKITTPFDLKVGSALL